MVQFHALQLLQKIKQHDRGALAKVVTALIRKSPPKSPLAQCLLIRYTTKVIGNNPTPTHAMIDFLTNCLHFKHSMVMYEAARSLCQLKQLPDSIILQATVVLQEFLNSPIPSHRFAAVRTFSELVSTMPQVVIPCQVDLEHLITDSSCNTATFAIRTLLKTVGESSVDRVLKSLNGFISEIPDELKIILVDAIRMCCLKYPQKYSELMGFLSNILREEGGYEYKKAIVDAFENLINTISFAKESGLEYLCEFIEDCEFPDLSVRILYLLGEEAPSTSNPSKYIRFVFNRIILELPSVRCAAVSSLAKFGASVPVLSHDICTLLRRCLNDNDDEVRDRARFFLDVLEKDKADVITNVLEVSFDDLEYSVQVYLENATTQPFTLDKVVANKDLFFNSKIPGEQLELTEIPEKIEKDEINQIPQFEMLGTKFKTTKDIELTESESDYVVSCTKHIFPEHIVFQFQITNMIEDQILENVSVDLDMEED